jgi:diguanylate cyclase (GGDEF)-like protein
VLSENSQLEAIGVSRDITQRKQAEDELRLANRSLQIAHKELQQMFVHEQLLARTDTLTGLFNRRHFFELAEREFSNSLRYQRSLALILFDVDGFKKANDTFGHAFGDKALVRISHAAKSQVREVDILARYGGDEFIVLMPETTAQQALLLTERIRQAVVTSEVDMGGAFLPLTVSLGIAEIIFDTDRSIETIISRADKALYQVKQQGRNHAAIYKAE